MPWTASTPGSGEAALKRGVESVGHPLTRALLVLTFSTGLVDAVSFLALGHVFTANMTGNVVLLGFGIAASGGLPVLAPLVSLAAFALGAVAGGLLGARLGQRHPKLVTGALGCEVALLGLAALLAGVLTVRTGGGAAYLIIALMACAMGLRSAFVRRLGVPDMTTTVLTMTLTGLAAESPLATGSGKGSTRKLAAVVAMLVGALVGALLLKSSRSLPLAVAAGLALATWLVYIPAAMRSGAVERSGAVPDSRR